MLVLTRKSDESIVIGDDIVVKIISVEKGVVKLGIDAPADVSILRNELIEAVEASNKEASSGSDNSFLDDFYSTFGR